MTERIDYNYNAQERVKVALKDPDQSNALVTAQIATAEATLALVEQKRIANLLALAQFSHEVGGDARIWTSEKFAKELRAEAAKALGYGA